MTLGEAIEFLQGVQEKVSTNTDLNSAIESLKNAADIVEDEYSLREQIATAKELDKCIQTGKDRAYNSTASEKGKKFNRWAQTLYGCVINFHNALREAATRDISGNCNNKESCSILDQRKDVKQIWEGDGETFTHWTEVVVALFVMVLLIFLVFSPSIFKTDSGDVNYDKFSFYVQIGEAVIILAIEIVFLYVNHFRKKNSARMRLVPAVAMPDESVDLSQVESVCLFCGEKNSVNAEDKKSHKCTRCGNPIYVTADDQEKDVQEWRETHTATLERLSSSKYEAPYNIYLPSDTSNGILFIPKVANKSKKIEKIGWIRFYENSKLTQKNVSNDQSNQDVNNMLSKLKYIYVPEDIELTDEFYNIFKDKGWGCEIVKFKSDENGKIKLQESQEVGNDKK